MNTRDREGDVRGMVDAYVHDLLDADDREFVRRRIAESDVWAAAHAEALRMRDLLRSTPALEPDARLIDSTLARVRTDGPRADRLRRRLIWTPIYAAAAAIALFLGVNFYFSTLSPSPYDVQVLGQTGFLAGSDASLRVHVRRADVNSAVAGADVELSLHDTARNQTVRLASFTTDDIGTGSPRFKFPDWPEGTYELRVKAQTPRGAELISHRIDLRRDWRVLLSTDKPVYQPGQTIRMRSLGIRTTGGAPVAGESVTFEVADAKGNLIFRNATVASRFGIAWADCLLADLLNEGSYTVRCRIGKAESVRAVEVKRYVLPKFRVDAAMDRPFYSPGEAASGSIDARYYFGKPVAGGAGRVSVSIGGPGSVAIEPVALSLDAEGRGRFEFRLPTGLAGSPTTDGDATASALVSVRDAAGQEVTRTLTFPVTTRPLRVTLVPESGRLVPGIENDIFVFVTTADGRPADASVAIEGLASELQTGEQGVASFSLTPRSESLSIAVRATDMLGRSTAERVTFEPDAAPETFVLRTDAPVYEAGGTMRISVFAAGSAAEPVFIDLVRDGQTILTDRVAVRAGRGEHSIDLPPDIVGTLRLVAYRFDSRGFPLRRERAIVVRPGSQLRVEVSPDAESRTYRPGETAPLTLRITDASGRAAPGALSLAIVDEAVSGVLNARPALDGVFGSLEQQLLEPVYAVYPWDPFSPVSPKTARGIAALLSRADGSDSRARKLRQLVDDGLIGEDVLDLLEGDRLERSLRMMGDSLSPEVIAFLRGGDQGAFPLRESTFEANQRRVEQARREWKHTREMILTSVGVIAAVAVLVLMLVLIARALHESIAVAISVLLSLVLLAGALLPSLGKARSSARQLRDATMLRGIGQALETNSILGSPRIDAAGPAAVRVRQYFPETLLWLPQLITDDAGRATLDVPLADSITTWRLTGGAVAADGRLGSFDEPIRVYQPFFVDLNAPVALTRGDEVEVPVVVYNYLASTQTISLEIRSEEWFELKGDSARTVALRPGEVSSVGIRLRAGQVGTHTLEVRATGADASGKPVADAIRREITVKAEGLAVERVENGTLRQPVELLIAFPGSGPSSAGAVPDSQSAVLKLYPSSFSQVLEGLDGIFQRPYGCFEQTSSTTYPNILALDYLRRARINAPQTEATALQYIHLGYQRLLSFEVAGGGFDWFGRPPANRTLTAYGLMQFADMARVRDVDQNMVARTRAWLLTQQRSDGSWDPEGHSMHDGPAARTAGLERFIATAYIAWSLFKPDSVEPAESRAAAFITGTSAGAIDDPYALALGALALRSCGDAAAAGPYIDRLLALKRSDGAGEVAFWSRPGAARTVFYGAGDSGAVETTALAALVLMESGREPATAHAALNWLTARRDSRGTWGTTQATVLALRALVLATDRPLGTGKPREITINVNGQPFRRVAIAADQSDVVQLIDLTPALAKAGPTRVSLEDTSRGNTAFQLSLRHNELAPDNSPRVDVGEPLAIRITYAASSSRVGEWLPASASVTNRMRDTMPMILLDLPIPPGFEMDTAALDGHVAAGRIAKYELTPRSAVVYLRQLAPGATLGLDYRIRATMPVEVEAAAPTASEYYNPAIRATGSATRLRAAD